MSDSAGYVHPPPSAERYFDIARGDLGADTQNVNGPEAVQAYALLSIAKSLMDIRDILGGFPHPRDNEWADIDEPAPEFDHVSTGSDGAGGFGHQ